MKEHTQPSAMPAYIQRGGEQELVAPCGLYGTQFYIFFLQADKQTLQALLDRLFNTPSGGALKYEVFSSYVAVMFTHVDKLTSSEASQGWAAYGDIAMWVPVIDKTGRLPKFKMYPVYMVVDNGSTMATGREVYGFPKEMGWFGEPWSPDFIGNLTVDVLGYENGNPTQQTIRNRLWHIIKETGNDDPAKFQPIKDMETLVHEIEGFASGIHENLEDEFFMGFDLLKNLLSIPALGLKQIRDIKNVDQAAFQAIVEAPLGLKKFRDARIFLDKYSFHLGDLATHPVAEETGLKVGANDVIFAFWLYADMELGTGQTNWQYGAE